MMFIILEHLFYYFYMMMALVTIIMMGVSIALSVYLMLNERIEGHFRDE